MEWRMIDNPVLSLIEQSLAAYRARRAGKIAMHGAYDIGRLKAWTDEHLANLGVGVLAAADRVYCEMHSYRTEEHTSELQSLMRTSYAVFCLKKTRERNHADEYT